ncbi:MAG: DUF6588 family protein [Candidatus Krumholzibacteriia bacterium]
MSMIDRLRRGAAPAAVLLFLPLAALAQDDGDDDLRALLEQVGADYAEAYISPFIHAHGPNQNSALYHTASVPGTGLHVTIGLKLMATQLDENDQTFRRVLENVEVGGVLPDDPVYDPYREETGTVVMSGPTVFGDTSVDGRVTVYVNGLPIYTDHTIPGLVDTRWVPLFAPQVTVGSVYGLSATLRWFPDLDLSDYGKSSFFGWGLSWGASALLPELPVDVMIGYFEQSLDVGTLLGTQATSLHLVVSKRLHAVTVYGGVAAESSELDVRYEFAGYDALPGSAGTVAFSVEGAQDRRLTLGATVGPVNAEISHGKLTTFGAGLLYGF